MFNIFKRHPYREAVAPSIDPDIDPRLTRAIDEGNIQAIDNYNKLVNWVNTCLFDKIKQTTVSKDKMLYLYDDHFTFTGDLTHIPNKIETIKKIIDKIKGLKAKLKYEIFGDSSKPYLKISWK